VDRPDPDAAARGCVICDAAANRSRESHERGLTRDAVLRRGVAAAAAAAVLGAGPLAQAARAHGGGRPHEPRGRRVLVQPSWVLTVENETLKLVRDHDVVVEDDRIAELRPRRKGWRGHRVRADGQLLVPGFISGHTHVAGGTTTRGIIEGGRSFARPLELADQLSDEQLDDITAFNLAELLRSGCTTQLEMSLSLKQAESYARVASRFGARGYPGGMIPGIHRLFPIWFRTSDQALFDSVPGTLEEIAANLAFGRRWNGAEGGLILPQMTPHATDTQTPETMQAIAAAARELGNGIHIHLSQSANETATVLRLWGKRPVPWLDDFGMYDGPLFGAHMSGIDLVADPPILAAHGAVYAHCPSGGGAGGGTQPWPEILAAGVRTNIGIDTHSNDYVENLKLAVLYGQARRSLIATTSPVPLQNPTIWDAMRAATLVPATALGRSDLGRIVPGAKADLATIDVTGFLTGTGAVPPEPLNNLLYAHGLSVRNVMTDGRWQLLDGQLVVADERRLAHRAGQAVQALWDALAAEGWFTPTPM
jgi:5-methylthioadenosine/S-adenosylhomocysteine deaminase